MRRAPRGAILLAVALAACGGPDAVHDAGADGGAADGAPMDAGPTCRGHAECDDGRYCNGAEQCEPGQAGADVRGCVSGQTPCGAALTCDEASRACSSGCAVPDADGDGHDAIDCGGDDCDDGDPNRTPGATETCDPDDRDEDCDTTTFGDRDADEDGYIDAACCNVPGSGALRCGDDCDDGDPSVHPTQSESCNERDDDCDGTVDEGVTRSRFFPDCDVDGHGDAVAAAREGCASPSEAPSGCPSGAWVETGPADDCDDASALRYPGLEEACDGVDNDCDEGTDEDVTFRDYWPDCDLDMRGDVTATPASACAPPAAAPAACASGGWATNAEDCADDAPARYLGNPESCDGLDNDCDARVDEGVTVTCYRDEDEDGFPPSSAVPRVGCGCTRGETTTPPAIGTTDCADLHPSVHPGVTAYSTTPYCASPATQVACAGLGVCIASGGTCGVSPATGSTSFDYDCSGAAQEDPSCGVPGSCSSCGCR